jgi:catechol 2,3-dioxygenase-like lactoylglutathione lyase family enzyme
MSIQFNHTIVHCHDKATSARFLADILGLPEPKAFGPFLAVKSENGVSLDFMDNKDKITPQHYAFLIGDQEFDQIFERVKSKGLKYWADPMERQENQINTWHGGRGFYFEDPDHHLLQVLTQQ